MLSLAGIDHITVSPPLLKALAADVSETPLTPTYTTPSAEGKKPSWSDLEGLADSEDRYKAAFGRNIEASRKLDEAIIIFLGYERKLEDIMEAELKVVKDAKDLVRDS